MKVFFVVVSLISNFAYDRYKMGVCKKGKKLTKACYESTVIWLVWEGLERLKCRGLHNTGGKCVHKDGAGYKSQSHKAKRSWQFEDLESYFECNWL